MIVYLIILALLLVVWLVVSYHTDLVIQEENDGLLHTIAMVNIDTVYETWIEYRESSATMLLYSTGETEKENAERAIKNYKERNKG